jgi:16S rRNA (guanine966-N2)-methyltransferase
VRVIAGRFGGRRLTAPDTDGTRPVTDRVKEAVFSSLGPEVVAAEVADLYAGAGSFGIEALSRGASRATFVESARPALVALRANLEALGLVPPEAVVAATTVERWLDRPSEISFDVVFCDPPWPLGSPALEATLSLVAGRVSEGGAVIVSRRASDPVPEPEGLVIDTERRYGDTRIMRYRKEGP